MAQIAALCARSMWAITAMLGLAAARLTNPDLALWPTVPIEPVNSAWCSTIHGQANEKSHPAPSAMAAISNTFTRYRQHAIAVSATMIMIGLSWCVGATAATSTTAIAMIAARRRRSTASPRGPGARYRRQSAISVR